MTPISILLDARQMVANLDILLPAPGPAWSRTTVTSIENSFGERADNWVVYALLHPWLTDIKADQKRAAQVPGANGEKPNDNPANQSWRTLQFALDHSTICGEAKVL